MEYAIYPHKYFKVTQSPYGAVSHCDYRDVNLPDDSVTARRDKSIDMGGQYTAGSYKEAYYAPFTCKVIDNHSTSSGTVYFVSCDSYGQNKPIIRADGKKTIVTMAMTHMNDVSHLTVGKIFSAGDLIYREGTAGGVAEHVHVSFAEGSRTRNDKEAITIQCKNKGVISSRTIRRFKNYCSLFPHQVLHKHQNYTISTYDESVYSDEKSIHYNKFKNIDKLAEKTLTGIRLRAITTVIVRDYPGSNTIIGRIYPTDIPVQICSFLGVSSKDKYQWVMVLFKGQYRYVQLDPKGYSIIDPTSIPNKPLRLRQWIYAKYNGFLVRSTPVNGGAITTVMKGSDLVIITKFLGIQDSYQWVEVQVNGRIGYVQLDTYNHVFITEY